MLDVLAGANMMENEIHGKASGADVQIVINGGCIEFTKVLDAQENEAPFKVRKF